MKSIYTKQEDELSLDEYFAFTIGQLHSYYSFKKHSHFDFNLYRFPPIFNWRFEGNPRGIYNDLTECVNLFKGKLKWTLVKYNRASYSLRPKVIDNIINEYGERESWSQFLSPIMKSCLYRLLKILSPYAGILLSILILS